MKEKFKSEEGSTMESSTRGSENAEEDASLHTKDRAYAEAEGAYNSDMGEGAERATLSSCGKRMATDKAGDYGAMSPPSRVGGSFGTQLPEKSSEEEASISRLV